ncbi:hypothetical protein [Endozoicomonas sp. ONNA2]|uniref:hypothetical protein n=1 Tax=Endozoicomonas sp. ONNA2 TaxID=2828741 RepID=UPI002147FDF3|nr:hypothetical protein [Endozoicomonas sp. ONNA2]
MSLITNKDVENLPSDHSGQVGNVKPVDRIDPMQSQEFSNLVKNKDDNKLTAAADDGEITPEELQRQIRENLFKNGFNRALDKAREIAKELRQG